MSSIPRSRIQKVRKQISDTDDGFQAQISHRLPCTINENSVCTAYRLQLYIKSEIRTEGNTSINLTRSNSAHATDDQMECKHSGKTFSQTGHSTKSSQLKNS